jgi:hypothetical protein
VRWLEFSVQAPTGISSRLCLQSWRDTPSAPVCSSSECAGDQSNSTGLGGGACVSLKSRFVVRIDSDGDAFRAAATASEESVRLIVWVGAEDDIVMWLGCEVGLCERKDQMAGSVLREKVGLLADM